MGLRRRSAGFVIKCCGLRKLQNGTLQRLIRAFLDEIPPQHLRDSHLCRSFHDRSEMHGYVHDTHVSGGAVDYLEFGVFRGDSIRQWISLNHHSESRFFGFDSFEGLPENWRAGQGQGHFHSGGAVPQIHNARVQFVKGWFDDMVPKFAQGSSAKNRLLLHLDADLYVSTMIPLVHFTQFMSTGTPLIFDELYDRDHEFKALQDW